MKSAICCALTLLAIFCGCYNGGQAFGPRDAVKGKVLVFTSPACSKCPSEAELNKLASEFSEFVFVHVNVSCDPDMARQYAVRQTPTFIVCSSEGCWRTTSLTELKTWLKNL